LSIAAFLNFTRFSIALTGLFLGTAFSQASTLTGTVTNGTTSKPAAGDEVILIKLAAGMEEAGHTKTDAQGKFTFKFDDANGPHLIRAIHQGVTYHKAAPPGTTTADVQVFDSSPKVDGVNAVADLMYLQAAKAELHIVRIFAVDNKSQPPRTQMNDAPFEFYVPEGAEIDGASAQTAGGQSVNVSPTPQAEKNRYAFIFPLRPGQTEFQVSIHMPYTGKATIDPRLIYPLQHFVAILPRSIAFKPAQSGVYEDKQPPDQSDAIAEVASNPQPGQKLSLAFEISGEGSLQDQTQNAGTGAPGTSTAAASPDTRPGGGLGPPSEAPDPLDKYRWPILAGVGGILVLGAIYITRSQSTTSAPPASSNRSATLLDALKEELFQLELEHKQGKISDQEYTTAKSALDQTLSRAIKRAQ
jgi:hypothetical protein